MKSAAKRLTLEIVGWTLVVCGILALVLPGPGLLLLFAGVAVLSQQYEWAERKLAPLKYHALKGAAESVASWLRMVATVVVAVGLVVCGVLWVWHPPAPSWWPLSDFWWLPGDVATGITQIVSGLIAGALLVYSVRRFRGKPEAVDELRREYDEAKSARAGSRAA